MSELIKFNLYPVNRHILIEPFEFETDKEEVKKTLISITGEKQEEERFTFWTVLKEYNSKELALLVGATICVENSMVERIKIKDETFFIILENYVVGWLTRKRIRS